MMSVLNWREKIHNDLRGEQLGLDHEGLAFYTQFYGLDSLDADIKLLKLSSSCGTYQWVAWDFYNSSPKVQGYALVTHGLFDHTAYMRPLIQSFLKDELHVLALELPGHGLDFKQALDCRGFDEYTAQNRAGMEWVKAQKSHLLVEAAHSTGAIGPLNRILEGQERQHKIVFLNPLIKIQMFRLAKLSYSFLSPLLSSVPRKKWGPGEGQDFLDFRARDPLQPWRIPQKWLSHYFEWAESVLNGKTLAPGENILVAQGGRDFVVNAKEAQKILASLVSNPKFSCYSSLGHQMLYGPEQAVQALLDEVSRWWGGAGGLRSS